MWPFKRKTAPTRKVFVAEGEGWAVRTAWQDRNGKLWIRSIDIGRSEIWYELADGGEVRPASNGTGLGYGPARRWRDAPDLRLADAHSNPPIQQRDRT